MTQRIPKLRLHKGTGQGYIEALGRRIYLGRHDRPETHQRYAQLIREYVVNGYRLPTPNDTSIVELLVAFVGHADGYYRRQDGTPTGETTNFRAALRPLRELYGTMQVAVFGPAQLKAVRQRVIESGACRSYANACTKKIRHVFRWGVAEGIVPADVLKALEAVGPLKVGRCDVRDTEPVLPVPQADIEAIRPHVSRQVWGMMQTQLLTAARPGEVCVLRPIYFDTSGVVWTARLDQHKLSYHRRERLIYFGRRAELSTRTFWTFGDEFSSPADARGYGAARSRAQQASRGRVGGSLCRLQT